MKIGDIVKSTKIRPNDTAVIVKSDVEIKKKEGKRPEIRTKYIAKYDDLSEITFYGFDINKSVFQVGSKMPLFDYGLKEMED